MQKYLSSEQLADFDKSFNSSRVNLAAMNAVTSGGVNTAARKWSSRPEGKNVFSIQLDNKGITNQKSSGRCWMFAAMNCLRYQVIHKWNLKEFEFSQSYVFFYDKLERANYFLEAIIDTVELDTTDRIVANLLENPSQDGGQWDMVCNIIEKYGLVPKDSMPESASSSASREMNQILYDQLRMDACCLREDYRAGKSIDQLREDKTGMMDTIYRILCICMGEPPETVDFEAPTESGDYIQDFSLTPLEFYKKYVDIDLTQYISLINSPTKDKPYYKSYTVKYLGNVLDGNIVRYVNLPIEELKKAAIAQLKDGEPVWFGSDVGKSSVRDSGLLDADAYDYDSLFGLSKHMDKAQRLDYGDSCMTHAMVFQGADLDKDGNPIRWRVENSWGDEAGFKGMFVMTDEWFTQYVYQVAINKKYLPKEVTEAYEKDPAVLDPWDPMGALAMTR